MATPASHPAKPCAAAGLPAEQGPCCDVPMLRKAHAAAGLLMGHAAAAGLLDDHATGGLLRSHAAGAFLVGRAAGGFLVGGALVLPRHEGLPLPVLAQLHAQHVPAGAGAGGGRGVR